MTDYHPHHPLSLIVYPLFFVVGFCGLNVLMKKKQSWLRGVANGHHTRANTDDGTVETTVIDVVSSDFATVAVVVVVVAAAAAAEGDMGDIHVAVAAAGGIGDILCRE